MASERRRLDVRLLVVQDTWSFDGCYLSASYRGHNLLGPVAVRMAVVVPIVLQSVEIVLLKCGIIDKT